MTQDRWLDQFLGDAFGPGDRDEVLASLRGHVLGTVVIEVENAGGSAAEHCQGALVEASRDPATWETAELFAVVTHHAATVWHLAPELLGEIAAKYPHIANGLAEAEKGPLFTFGVPDDDIVQYLGPDAGSAGYRWPADDGRTLAVVLWQDILHVTGTGDVAPGFGPVTIEESP